MVEIYICSYVDATKETQSLTVCLHLGWPGVDVSSLDILIGRLLTNQNVHTTMQPRQI